MKIIHYIAAVATIVIWTSIGSANPDVWPEWGLAPGKGWIAHDPTTADAPELIKFVENKELGIVISVSGRDYHGVKLETVMDLLALGDPTLKNIMRIVKVRDEQVIEIKKPMVQDGRRFNSWTLVFMRNGKAIILNGAYTDNTEASMKKALYSFRFMN